METWILVMTLIYSSTQGVSVNINDVPNLPSEQACMAIGNDWEKSLGKENKDVIKIYYSCTVVKNQTDS